MPRDAHVFQTVLHCHAQACCTNICQHVLTVEVYFGPCWSAGGGKVRAGTVLSALEGCPDLGSSCLPAGGGRDKAGSNSLMLSNEELARVYPGLPLDVAAAAHAAAQAALVNVSMGGSTAGMHTLLGSSAVPAAANPMPQAASPGLMAAPDGAGAASPAPAPSQGHEPEDAGSDAAAVQSAGAGAAGGKGGASSSAEVHEPDSSAAWNAEDEAAPGLQGSRSGSVGGRSMQGAAGASQEAPRLQGQGQAASSRGTPSPQEVLAQGLPSTQAFSMAMTGSSSGPGAPTLAASGQKPPPGSMSPSISMLGQGRGAAKVGATGFGGGLLSRGRPNHASVAYQQWRRDVRDVRETNPPPPAPDVRELDPKAQQAYHQMQMEQRRQTEALREAGRSAIRGRGRPGGARLLQPPRQAQGSYQVGTEWFAVRGGKEEPG